MLMADYQSYVEAQEKVSRVYLNQEQWTRMSILSVARIGKFSSDRAVKEYCANIWDIKPVHINTD
jgi:starch phosphorylase